MKTKMYLPLLLLFFYTKIGNSQTTTQGDITLDQFSNFNHDSTSCTSFGFMSYNITIANSFTNDTIWVVNTSDALLLDTMINHTGQNPWTVSLTLNNYGNFYYYFQDINLYNTPGSAFMNAPNTKIVNKHSNSSLDTLYNISNMIVGYVDNPCIYQSVSGKVYIDNNSNCSFDGTDSALNAVILNGTSLLISPSSTPSYSMGQYSNANGDYNVNLQQTYMSSYTVQLPSNYQFIFPSSFCSPGIYNGTTLPQTNINFPLQCSSNIDVQCYATSNGIVRPNVPFFMYPTVSNIGCIEAAGTLKLVLDNRVTYDSSLSTNPANSIVGDTLIWNYANLTNLTNNGYWNSFASGIHLTPNTSVAAGDTLCFRVMATLLSNDSEPLNNDYSICLPVVSSYDPNYKEVSPRGQGANGEIPTNTSKLTYTIHFQNTGTADAYYVGVIDTLNSNIIPNSLKILGSSHNVDPEWLAPGVVRFNFNNIYLADSATNEPKSHGSITFSVELNAGLTVGTQIKNTGYIYFDYNSPVVTNTTTNTIVQSTAGVTELSNSTGKIKVYPNPFNDRTTFIIQSDKQNENYSFEVMDVLGKNVKSIQNISSKEFSFSREGLQNGVYFYKIKTGENVLQVGKLVIQ